MSPRLPSLPMPPNFYLSCPLCSYCDLPEGLVALEHVPPGTLSLFCLSPGGPSSTVKGPRRGRGSEGLRGILCSHGLDENVGLHWTNLDQEGGVSDTRTQTRTPDGVGYELELINSLGHQEEQCTGPTGPLDDTNSGNPKTPNPPPPLWSCRDPLGLCVGSGWTRTDTLGSVQ